MDWFAGREQRRRWWPEAARLGRESNLGEGGMGFGRGRWRGCGVRGYKRAQAVANLCDLRAARREEVKPNALEGGCGWRRPGAARGLASGGAEGYAAREQCHHIVRELC